MAGYLLVLVILCYLLALLVTGAEAAPVIHGGAPRAFGADGTTEVLFVVKEPHEDWFHPTSEHGGVGAEVEIEVGRSQRGLAGTPGLAALCRLDLRTLQRDILVWWAPGDIQGWDLHPDGRRCVVSVRQGDAQAPYHLVEVDLDHPQAWRVLTEGPDDDIDPVYLPDGQIAFASNRSPQWSELGDARLFTTHLCAADGSVVRPYSTRPAMQRTPSVMPDGRLLRVEWEAGGAEGGSGFHLLTGWPDGMHEAVVDLGPWQGLSLTQARAVSGGSEWVAIATPAGALTRDKGWLVLIDLKFGPASIERLRIVGTDPDRWRPTEAAAGSVGEPLLVEHPEFCWRQPYPLSEDRFLVTTDRSICVVSAEGVVDVLYAETELPGELGGARLGRL